MIIFAIILSLLASTATSMATSTDAPRMEIVYVNGEYRMTHNLSEDDKCRFMVDVFEVYCVNKTWN